MKVGTYSKALAPLIAGLASAAEAYLTGQPWQQLLIQTLVTALIAFLVPNAAVSDGLVKPPVEPAPSAPQNAPEPVKDPEPVPVQGKPLEQPENPPQAVPEPVVEDKPLEQPPAVVVVQDQPLEQPEPESPGVVHEAA